MKTDMLEPVRQPKTPNRFSKLVGVLVVMTVLAVGTIWLQAQTVRTGYSIQKLKSKTKDLKRTNRRLEFEAQREKSTQELMDKAHRFKLDLDFPIPGAAEDFDRYSRTQLP